jgi:hypothetical protein
MHGYTRYVQGGDKTIHRPEEKLMRQLQARERETDAAELWAIERERN